MNIKEINDKFSSGQYQDAIVNYTSYLSVMPSMNSFVGAAIQAGYRRLGRHLLEKAYKVADLRYDYQLRNENSTSFLNVCILDSPTAQPVEINSTLKHSKNIEFTYWYRFDFVALDPLCNERGLLRIPFISLNGTILYFSYNFKNGDHHSFLFPSLTQLAPLSCSENSLCINGYGFSYYLTLLNQSQLIEQLYQLFTVNEVGIDNIDFDSFTKIVQNADHKSMISSYINRYILLENCNNLDNNIILESLITSICKNIPSYDNDILNYYDFSQYTRKSILVSSPDQLGLGIEFHVNSVFLYNSLYIIIGWMVDFKKEIYSVRFVNNLGEPEIDFFESLVYFNRSDVTQYLLKSGREGASQCAFVCVKHTSHGVGSAIDVPKILEVRTKSGSFFQVKIDLIHLPNGKENLSPLMQSFSELSITYNSCKKIFGPIFKSICLENSKKSNFKISKNLYNQIEKKPTLSVIIPLYGSTRFEMTQIPLIASLNKIDWEIIFAVDDVSIKSAVIDNVCRLSEYYNISMSIVSSDTNMGFAGINNLAFKQARADIVLFLNSDCFITNSAPILRGLQWLTTQTDAGAVGFRLLYADNSIQHDGMSIEKWVEQPDFLINVHPRSGLPSRLIPQHVNEDDAVLLTAACLMIPKSIFNAIDGFDIRYFLGDFEDSDICLKICSIGKKLGIVRSNDIFHLERQSFCEIDKLIQSRVTLTNSQIYTERWREFLNTRLPSLTVI